MSPFPLALIIMQGDSIIPRPPAPSAFEAYGFAGIIFGSFFFLVCAVIILGGRYFAKRDELFIQSQRERDQMLRDSLSGLGASHEKAVERITTSAERVGETAAAANREIATSLKELQREVQTSHKVFGEETIMALFRRAIRDVKDHG